MFTYAATSFLHLLTQVVSSTVELHFFCAAQVRLHESSMAAWFAGAPVSPPLVDEPHPKINAVAMKS